MGVMASAGPVPGGAGASEDGVEAGEGAAAEGEYSEATPACVTATFRDRAQYGEHGGGVGGRAWG